MVHIFKIFLGGRILNFHSWIIDRYSFFVGDGTIIEDGDVTNLLAVVFLSGGIVGTLLFALYLSSLFNHVSLDNKAFLFVFIFCFMLVYGAITEPHLLFLSIFFWCSLKKRMRFDKLLIFVIREINFFTMLQTSSYICNYNVCLFRCPLCFKFK